MKTLKEIVEKEFKKLSAPKDWLITIENAKEKSYDIAQATRKDTLREVLWKIPRIKTFDELITWLKIEICYYGNKEAKIKEVEK